MERHQAFWLRLFPAGRTDFVWIFQDLFWWIACSYSGHSWHKIKQHTLWMLSGECISTQSSDQSFCTFHWGIFWIIGIVVKQLNIQASSACAGTCNKVKAIADLQQKQSATRNVRNVCAGDVQRDAVALREDNKSAHTVQRPNSPITLGMWFVVFLFFFFLSCGDNTTTRCGTASKYGQNSVSRGRCGVEPVTMHWCWWLSINQPETAGTRRFSSDQSHKPKDTMPFPPLCFWNKKCSFESTAKALLAFVCYSALVRFWSTKFVPKIIAFER